MIYSLKNEYIELSVSDRGAEPVSIRSSDGTEYLWTGEKEYWPGRAPHLFPFVGRLFEQRYLYDGVSYPLSIHGFLKDSVLELEKQSGGLVFRLKANETTLRQYPFDFCLHVCYELFERTVAVTFKVKNNDKKPMPFAIGGHPGFNVPLEKGLTFEDYYLEFQEPSLPKRAEPTDTVLLNGRYHDYPLKDGRVIELRHSLFDDDAIVLKDISRSVTLKSDRSSRAVRVDFPGFKYLGIWHTVRTDAPFVCIEPWTALQGFENSVMEIDKNSDMTVLQKGEEYKNEWTINIIE